MVYPINVLQHSPLDKVAPIIDGLHPISGQSYLNQPINEFFAGENVVVNRKSPSRMKWLHSVGECRANLPLYRLSAAIACLQLRR